MRGRPHFGAMLINGWPQVRSLQMAIQMHGWSLQRPPKGIPNASYCMLQLQLTIEAKRPEITKDQDFCKNCRSAVFAETKWLPKLQICSFGKKKKLPKLQICILSRKTKKMHFSGFHYYFHRLLGFDATFDCPMLGIRRPHMSLLCPELLILCILYCPNTPHIS